MYEIKTIKGWKIMRHQNQIRSRKETSQPNNHSHLEVNLAEHLQQNFHTEELGYMCMMSIQFLF